RAKLPSADRLLQRQEEAPAPLLLLGRDGVPERLGPGAGLGRIRECPDVVELGLAYELAELAEFRVALAGKTHDERRADGDLRNQLPHPAEHLPVCGRGAAAAHCPKEWPGHMLERNVHVGNETRLRRH